MSRRAFLGMLSCAAFSGACAVEPAAPRASRRPVRAIAFDLFTLFDPRSVIEVAREHVADDAAAFCQVWRDKQFQYAFLRAAGDRYVDFRVVTEDALVFAARSRKLELTPGQREQLVGAYTRLTPWPDTTEALARFRAAGLKLAPLANFAPTMIDQLLANAGLAEAFDARISTDAARTYKPDPRAYALGPEVLGFDRNEIAFSAFGGWDAIGARWFGFPTFWVNRLGVPGEELGVGPDGTGPTLAELADFVRAWA